MEKLGAGALGDVQDVERGREGSTGLDGGNVPTHQFRHDRDGQRHGFDRLRAASARDARGRAGGVVLAIRHDGGARLLDEQAHRTGGAEDQERHDERERKTSHLTILLLSERPIVDAGRSLDASVCPGEPGVLERLRAAPRRRVQSLLRIGLPPGHRRAPGRAAAQG